MDVTLLKASLYDLPSNLRVGAIAHDGAADMQLWPGPGPDTDLRVAWGEDLQKTLDAELRQLPGRVLPVPGVARIARGRLHADFLAWIATRPPEPGTERQPAPDAAMLREAVKATLRFVAERSVMRIAFPALGAGPGELDRIARLVEIARAANEYQDECRAAGRSPVVEEVLICEPDTKVYTLAGRQIRNLAKTREITPAAPKEPKPEPKKRASEKRAATPARKTSRLSEEDVARRRMTAEPYDMKRRYAPGDWFLHARFGVGRVELLTPEGAVQVLFEDGEMRKMVHGRT